MKPNFFNYYYFIISVVGGWYGFDSSVGFKNLDFEKLLLPTELQVVPWESFVGGECDTVVYVGTGSLEAFSRARLKLMIITVSPREQRGDIVNNFYGYNVGLRNSVEKNLLE